MFNNDKIKMLERRIALLEPKIERPQEYENKIFHLESRINCLEGRHELGLLRENMEFMTIEYEGCVHCRKKADPKSCVEFAPRKPKKKAQRNAKR